MTKKYFFRGDICDGFENSDFVEIAGNPHKNIFFVILWKKVGIFVFCFCQFLQEIFANDA
jgi:hypothetical protein